LGLIRPDSGDSSPRPPEAQRQTASMPQIASPDAVKIRKPRSPGAARRTDDAPEDSAETCFRRRPFMPLPDQRLRISF
jgi:hypothetical protein